MFPQGHREPALSRPAQTQPLSPPPVRMRESPPSALQGGDSAGLLGRQASLPNSCICLGFEGDSLRDGMSQAPLPSPSVFLSLHPESHPTTLELQGEARATPHPIPLNCWNRNSSVTKKTEGSGHWAERSSLPGQRNPGRQGESGPELEMLPVSRAGQEEETSCHMPGAE